MVQIILNSGTTWVVPSDWNNADNSVQCFGGGAAGAGSNGGKTQLGAAGGGAGAYARGDNISLTRGSTIQVRIGAGGSPVSTDAGNPGGDTCFNATSLTDAVSNGNTISVAAPGGSPSSTPNNSSSTGGPGGVGTAGVGNHTRTSGGAGGNATLSGNSGAGGNCPNGGAGGASLSTSGTGNPGNIPGGGGSGGKAASNNGGAGAAGRIIINYEPLPPGQHRMFMVFN